MKHPHGSKRKAGSLIDKLIYGAAIFYPLTTVPQIIKIFQTKSARDFAIYTWVLSAFFELIFLAYGFKHKLTPIRITAILWLCMYAAIITGIVLYG